jgi:chromate transporter
LTERRASATLGAMADPADRVAQRPAPTLAAIACVFGRHANTTLGGGSATIAVLRQHLVARHAWLDDAQFDLGYALSRLTPGTNLLAFCTAAGWTARRWPGALIALLAASIPCSILAVVVTAFYGELQASPLFAAALRGALAAAVAIMLSTAWVFAEPHARAAPRKALAVAPTAAALSLGLHLSPIEILLLAALAGAAWPAPPRNPEPR